MISIMHCVHGDDTSNDSLTMRALYFLVLAEFNIPTRQRISSAVRAQSPMHMRFWSEDQLEKQGSESVLSAVECHLQRRRCEQV